MGIYIMGFLPLHPEYYSPQYERTEKGPLIFGISRISRIWNLRWGVSMNSSFDIVSVDCVGFCKQSKGSESNGKAGGRYNGNWDYVVSYSVCKVTNSYQLHDFHIMMP